MPGAKYVSGMNAAEVERTVGSDFAHDVLPIAFNIRLALGGGYSYERACGSAELNGLRAGSTEVTISSEFATPHDASGQVRSSTSRSPHELQFSLRAPDLLTSSRSPPGLLPISS